MAIETLMPDPAAAPAPEAGDMVPFFSCLAWLEETGYPMAESTLRRLIKRRSVVTEYRNRGLGRGRRTLYVSASDVMELHRDWVDEQIAEGRLV